MVATRRRSNSRVTIADVAREAGVNKGTVSRALRGVPGVGRSTRQRILEAADRLDFSASHIATALATGVSQTVGVVIPNLRSWYFGEVAAGASEVLIPAGYVTTVYDPVYQLTPDGKRYVSKASDKPTAIPAPGLPFSLVFRAEPGKEDVLLKIASAYEAASQRRVPPPDFGPV